MRNLIISCILLALVVGFTAISSYNVCRICDEMISLVDAGEIGKAYEIWQGSADYISFFVRDAEIDVVTAELEGVYKSLPIEDGEREAACIALRDAINEIRRSEQPSFRSVF